MNVVIPFNFLRLSPDIWNGWFDTAIDYMAWQKRTFIAQVVSAFCTANRDYLLTICDADGKARGLDPNSAEFFQAYLDWSKPLPPYTDGKRPDLERSPLFSVVMPPADDTERRSFNGLRISQLNSVFLRVLQAAEGDRHLSEIIAKMVIQHFDKYGYGYELQTEADRQQSIRPHTEILKPQPQSK